MSTDGQHLQRLHFLSVLRVIATITVVFGHASSFYGGFGFTQWPRFPYIQNIAVIVFFCLSGYTIAWVCHQRTPGTGAGAFGRFAFDRFMRLAIPLIPLLLICALAEPWLLGGKLPHPESFTARSLAGNMFFLQWLTPKIANFSFALNVHPFGLNRPLWTLSLEFWTYILFAAAYFALSGAAIRLWLLAVSALAAFLMGSALYGGQGSGLPLIWLLGAGAYFALLRLPNVTRRARLAALFLLVPAAALLFQPALWPPNGGSSKLYNLMVFAIFLLALVAVSGSLLHTGQDRPAIQPFVDFAYSTYIVHYPVMHLLHNAAIFPEGELGALLATAVCIACGYVFYLPFERNYKSLRERFRRRLRPPLKTYS